MKLAMRRWLLRSGWPAIDILQRNFAADLHPKVEFTDEYVRFVSCRQVTLNIWMAKAREWKGGVQFENLMTQIYCHAIHLYLNLKYHTFEFNQFIGVQFLFHSCATHFNVIVFLSKFLNFNFIHFQSCVNAQTVRNVTVGYNNIKTFFF